MKKIIVLIAACGLTMGMTSCSDDADIDTEAVCNSALEDLTTSAALWATSPTNHTEVNCNIFKANLLSALNNCDTEIYWDLYGGEEGWQVFVSEIEALDCSMFP